MTQKRGIVEASLAERGRPVDWANENESAALCGLEKDKYHHLLPKLERDGFPQKNAINGKRYIPAIREFWALQIDSIVVPAVKSPPGPSEDQDNGRQPGKWGARG